MSYAEVVCCKELPIITDKFQYGIKQSGPRTDCSYRSSLIWVHSVCQRDFFTNIKNISRREKQTTPVVILLTRKFTSTMTLCISIIMVTLCSIWTTLPCTVRGCSAGFDSNLSSARVITCWATWIVKKHSSPAEKWLIWAGPGNSVNYIVFSLWILVI